MNMLELMPGYPDNVIVVEARGEVTAEDYQQFLVPAIEAKLQEHRRVRLLYLLGEDFEGFSSGAAWEDSKFGMRHFADFERIAVVSDTEWVRRLVKGFSFALPSEVRVYDLDERTEAEAWISAPQDPGELEFTLDEARSLLLLEPRDELEEGDFDRLAATLDPYLEDHGELAGLVVVTHHFPGWDDMAALIAHLGFVRGHHRQVRRVAFVSESRFLAAVPRFAGLFVQAEVRRFEPEARDEALAWAAGEAG